MWLIAEYEPNALFSLRSSAATSSGGRTNLCPTMYAVKMALLDVALRSGQDGQEVFDLLKDIGVRLSPSIRAVVSNCFVRIQREPHDKGEQAFQSTVAYREYVFLSGPFSVALDVARWTEAEVERVGRLLSQVNYFGKRGSFAQFKGLRQADALDRTFSYVLGDERPALTPDMVVQFLDDFGPEATFDAINSYSSVKQRLGRHRVIIPVGLPYRMKASSRGYTLYERTAG